MVKITLKQSFGRKFDVEIHDDGSQIECLVPNCTKGLCKHVFLAVQPNNVDYYHQHKISISDKVINDTHNEWNKLSLRKRIFI